MQLMIKKEINYVEEANILLFIHVNSITFEKMMKESYRKFTYSKELFDKRYGQILKIYNHVTDNMRIEKNKLEFYFKEIGNSKLSLSNYLLPIYTETRFETLQEYMTSAREKSNAELVKDFSDVLSQYCSIGNSGNESGVDTFEDLMRIMDKADLTTEDKWKIAQAFIDHDTHLKEVCNIFDKTIRLMEECRNDINGLEQEFYDYWADYAAGTDFLKELQEYTNVVWQYGGEGTVIIPSLFRPLSISLSINDEEDKKPDKIRLGVILDSSLSYKPSEVDGEKLNTVLKLLSDKSKFEILKLIKDKPAYGFKIASALNLSTSTISYHMNGLISADLIKLEKDANKIYYSMNKEAISQFLEDIRTLLL